MFKVVQVSAVSAIVSLVAQGALGITIDQTSTQSAHVSQAQQFYSSTVSRVAGRGGQACMVSTGSNWKATGAARRASDVAGQLDAGLDIHAAFAQTPAVPMQDLSSNTPYLSFVIDDQGQTLLRFATGFKMKVGTVDVIYGSQRSEIVGLEIEERGDTGRIDDLATVDAMFSAFMAGEIFTITARSDKLSGAQSEHYLQYQFDGQGEFAELSSCLDDLKQAELALTPSPVPSFSLAPVDTQDTALRQSVRGMACNRALDPNGAELVRLDGPITGFSSPLSHALVQRDEAGEIEHIWSGDLWRISRSGDGYAMAFSNSITQQGPMDAQTEKACTQFGQAAPVSLGVDDAGGLDVKPDMDRYLASALPADFLRTADPIVASDAFAGTTRAGSRLASAGGSGGGTSGGSFVAATNTLPLVVRQSDTQSISTLFDDDTSTGGTGSGGGTTSVSAVPVPGAGLLLLGAIAGAGGLSRRRTKAAS